MASSAVTRAFIARLADLWTDSPIAGPNEGGEVPSDGSAFLTYEFPYARETMLTIGAPGANHWKEEGSFRVILRVPLGEGINPSVTPWPDRIDALRAAFRGQTFDAAQITVFEVGPPIVNDSSDQGAYFDISFSLLYWYYFTG